MLAPRTSAIICNVRHISYSYSWLLYRFGYIPLTGFAVVRHQISLKYQKKIPVSGTMRPQANDNLHANCQDFQREATSAIYSQSSPPLHFIIPVVSPFSRHFNCSLEVMCLSLPILKAWMLKSSS